MDVDVDAWTTGVSGYSPEVPFDSVPDDPKNDGYAVLCTCSANKKVKSVLGEAACNHLKSFWPNLKWSGKLNGVSARGLLISGLAIVSIQRSAIDASILLQCKDTANVGLKPLGFEAACQEVSQFENSPFNSTPLHPIALAIRAKCLKYSNHVDN